MTDASTAGSQFTRETRVVASSDAASAGLEGETVILGMRDGVYYGLDAVGTRIWALVAEPTTLGTVHAAVVAEYDVTAERAWDDLVALARDLVAAGLLTRLDGA